MNMHEETEKLVGQSTGDWDGYERIGGAELLRRHRESEAVRGDYARAIATLEERVARLELALAQSILSR